MGVNQFYRCCAHIIIESDDASLVHQVLQAGLVNAQYEQHRVGNVLVMGCHGAIGINIILAMLSGKYLEELMAREIG